MGDFVLNNFTFSYSLQLQLQLQLQVNNFTFPVLSIKLNPPVNHSCHHRQAKVPSISTRANKTKNLEIKAEEASGPPTYLGLAKAIRKLRIAGIFQHYYPEGGWGYVIIISALLVQIIAPGVQLSMGMVMVQILTRRQSISQVSVTQAGKISWHILLTIETLQNKLFHKV